MPTCEVCGTTESVHLYINQGLRCPAHTPAAMAGRPDHVPDPERTLDGLRDKAGIRYTYNRRDTALNDQRAIASGKRRSTPEQYRAAVAAEAERKAARRT